MKKILTIILSTIIIIVLASCKSDLNSTINNSTNNESNITETNESSNNITETSESSSSITEKKNSIVDKKLDETLSSNLTTEFTMTSETKNSTKNMGKLDVSFDSYADFKEDGLLSHVNFYLENENGDSFIYFDGTTLYNKTNEEDESNYKVTSLDTVSVKYLLNNTSTPILSLLDMSNESLFTIDSISNTSVRLVPTTNLSLMMPDMKNVIISMGSDTLINNIELNMEHKNEDESVDFEKITLAVKSIEKKTVTVNEAEFPTMNMPYNLRAQLIVDAIVLFNRTSTSISLLENGFSGNLNLILKGEIFDANDTSNYNLNLNFKFFMDKEQITDPDESKTTTNNFKFDVTATADDKLANLVVMYINSVSSDENNDNSINLDNFVPKNLKFHLFYLGGENITVYIINDGMNVFSMEIPFDLSNLSDNNFDFDSNTTNTEKEINNRYIDNEDDEFNFMQVILDSIMYLKSSVTDNTVEFYLEGDIFDEINSNISLANSYLGMNLPNLKIIIFKTTFIDNLPIMNISIKSATSTVASLTINITGSPTLDDFSETMNNYLDSLE